MQYWSALAIINQIAGELGMTKVQSLFNPDTTEAEQSSQLLAALQSAGNELLLYYPFEEFRKEWSFSLIADQGSYDLPPGWAYFIDQTQWDRTNHWPLLGPKSAAEWAWLKGGLLASFPRMRYRVMGNKFQVWPVPQTGSEYTLAMEFMSDNWVQSANSPDQTPDAAMVAADGDICWYHPWLLIKFTKLKWSQLKGINEAAAQADFQRIWDSLKGKDVGAPVLSLAPVQTPFFIGPWSVPDGSWNT